MPNSSTSSAATSQASRACAAQTLNQSQAKSTPNPYLKPRPTIKKPTIIPSKPLVGPNPLIQAAAFAAGGRIANPSTAASLFKAAQSKNAVHIRPGGSNALQISSSLPNKPTAVAPNPLVRPLSSFGTTLSSQRSIQPSAKLDAVENGEGKKNSDVEELSSIEGSGLSKDQNVIEKEEHLPKGVSNEASAVEANETKNQVKESREDDCVDKIEVAADESKELCAESTTAKDSK